MQGSNQSNKSKTDPLGVGTKKEGNVDAWNNVSLKTSSSHQSSQKNITTFKSGVNVITPKKKIQQVKVCQSPKLGQKVGPQKWDLLQTSSHHKEMLTQFVDQLLRTPSFSSATELLKKQILCFCQHCQSNSDGHKVNKFCTIELIELLRDLYIEVKNYNQQNQNIKQEFYRKYLVQEDNAKSVNLQSPKKDLNLSQINVENAKEKLFSMIRMNLQYAQRYGTTPKNANIPALEKTLLGSKCPERICKNYFDAAFTNIETSLNVQIDSYKLEVERISKQILAEKQSYQRRLSNLKNENFNKNQNIIGSQQETEQIKLVKLELENYKKKCDQLKLQNSIVSNQIQTQYTTINESKQKYSSLQQLYRQLKRNYDDYKATIDLAKGKQQRNQFGQQKPIQYQSRSSKQVEKYAKLKKAIAQSVGPYCKEQNQTEELWRKFINTQINQHQQCRNLINNIFAKQFFKLSSLTNQINHYAQEARKKNQDLIQVNKQLWLQKQKHLNEVNILKGDQQRQVNILKGQNVNLHVQIDRLYKLLDSLTQDKNLAQSSKQSLTQQITDLKAESKRWQQNYGYLVSIQTETFNRLGLLRESQQNKAQIQNNVDANNQNKYQRFLQLSSKLFDTIVQKITKEMKANFQKLTKAEDQLQKIKNQAINTVKYNQSASHKTMIALQQQLRQKNEQASKLQSDHQILKADIAQKLKEIKGLQQRIQQQQDKFKMVGQQYKKSFEQINYRFDKQHQQLKKELDNLKVNSESKLQQQSQARRLQYQSCLHKIRIDYEQLLQSTKSTFEQTINVREGQFKRQNYEKQSLIKSVNEKQELCLTIYTDLNGTFDTQKAINESSFSNLLSQYKKMEQSYITERDQKRNILKQMVCMVKEIQQLQLKLIREQMIVFEDELKMAQMDKNMTKKQNQVMDLKQLVENLKQQYQVIIDQTKRVVQEQNLKKKNAQSKRLEQLVKYYNAVLKQKTVMHESQKSNFELKLNYLNCTLEANQITYAQQQGIFTRKISLRQQTAEKQRSQFISIQKQLRKQIKDMNIQIEQKSEQIIGLNDSIQKYKAELLTLQDRELFNKNKLEQYLRTIANQQSKNSFQTALNNLIDSVVQQNEVLGGVLQNISYNIDSLRVQLINKQSQIGRLQQSSEHLRKQNVDLSVAVQNLTVQISSLTYKKQAELKQFVEKTTSQGTLRRQLSERMVELGKRNQELKDVNKKYQDANFEVARKNTQLQRQQNQRKREKEQYEKQKKQDEEVIKELQNQIDRNSQEINQLKGQKLRLVQQSSRKQTLSKDTTSQRVISLQQQISRLQNQKQKYEQLLKQNRMKIESAQVKNQELQNKLIKAEAKANSPVVNTRSTAQMQSLKRKLVKIQEELQQKTITVQSLNIQLQRLKRNQGNSSQKMKIEEMPSFEQERKCLEQQIEMLKQERDLFKEQCETYQAKMESLKKSSQAVSSSGIRVGSSRLGSLSPKIQGYLSPPKLAPRPETQVIRSKQPTSAFFRNQNLLDIREAEKQFLLTTIQKIAQKKLIKTRQMFTIDENTKFCSIALILTKTIIVEQSHLLLFSNRGVKNASNIFGIVTIKTNLKNNPLFAVLISLSKQKVYEKRQTDMKIDAISYNTNGELMLGGTFKFKPSEKKLECTQAKSRYFDLPNIVDVFDKEGMAIEISNMEIYQLNFQ